MVASALRELETTGQTTHASPFIRYLIYKALAPAPYRTEVVDHGAPGWPLWHAYKGRATRLAKLAARLAALGKIRKADVLTALQEDVHLWHRPEYTRRAPITADDVDQLFAPGRSTPPAAARLAIWERVFQEEMVAEFFARRIVVYRRPVKKITLVHLEEQGV